MCRRCFTAECFVRHCKPIRGQPLFKNSRLFIFFSFYAKKWEKGGREFRDTHTHTHTKQQKEKEKKNRRRWWDKDSHLSERKSSKCCRPVGGNWPDVGRVSNSNASPSSPLSLLVFFSFLVPIRKFFVSTFISRFSSNFCPNYLHINLVFLAKINEAKDKIWKKKASANRQSRIHLTYDMEMMWKLQMRRE